jgi:hypothetical protein
MSDFEISYKQSYISFVVLTCMAMLCAPLFFFAAIHDSPLHGYSLFSSTVNYLFFFAICLVTVIYCIYVIYLNFGQVHKISFSNNTLRFRATPYAKKYTYVNIHDVNYSKVIKASRSSTYILSIHAYNRKYAILDTNFSSREFSIICNTIVKRSNRCKACQSMQVTWENEHGHCHNCETITPRNSDEFDWRLAYQA